MALKHLSTRFPNRQAIMTIGLVLFFNTPLLAQTNSSAIEYKWERGQQHEYKFKVIYEIDGDDRELEGKAEFELHEKDVAKNLTNNNLEEFEEGESTSTAFAVSPDGFLLTCAHCIRGAKTISISIGEQKKTARVIDADYEQDLALLKIEANNLPFVTLGKNNPVELAQDVRAIGYPLSDVLGNSVKIARGSIAGFIDKGGELPNLQLDVAVNFGNSGGPLVNEAGAVVGVVNAKLSGETIAKVGFAIPIKLACKMLDRNNVKYDSQSLVRNLSGPELAKRVTPSVFFVHTNIGPGGEGKLSNFRYSLDGSLSRPIDNGSRQNETIRSHAIIGTDGSLLDSESEVSLPLLLGYVCQIPFERLPAYSSKSWSFNGLYTVSLPKSAARKRRRSDPFRHMHPFGRMDPYRGMRDLFGTDGTDKPETRDAVAECKTNYKILKQEKNLISISKEFTLKTIDDSREYASVKLKYEGVLVFDTQIGMFISQKTNGDVDMRLGDELTKIPFEMRYNRVASGGQSAIAKNPKSPGLNQQDRPVATKPVRLSMPESGLTKEQIDRLLNYESESMDSSEMLGYLNRLAKWNEAKNRKTEIVKTLAALASSESAGVRKLAIDALLNWDPKTATPHVVDGFNNANRFSKRSWIAKLGRTKNQEAAWLLCEQLLDSASRRHSQKALMELGPKGEAAVSQTLRQNYDNTIVAKACLEVLGEHGTLASEPIIRDVAKRPGWKLGAESDATLQRILKRK